MPITPDQKDWTWVLERRCPECGIDVQSLSREQVPALIRDNASRWPGLLEHPDVARRPSDDVWSGLEYACHVRDVYRLYDERLQLMLGQDDPLYPNWDQDEAAVSNRYSEQTPSLVAKELVAAADALADRFERVEGGEWERPGRRSDGVSFTIESFARYLIHDPIHHLNDVEKGYARLAGA